MEKRSRRRTRDLVAQAASQSLSENEIGCARISMMARSKNAPFKGRIQKRKTLSLRCSFRLATHGRSIQMCQERPFWSRIATERAAAMAPPERIGRRRAELLAPAVAG